MNVKNIIAKIVLKDSIGKKILKEWYVGVAVEKAAYLKSALDSLLMNPCISTFFSASIDFLMEAPAGKAVIDRNTLEEELIAAVEEGMDEVLNQDNKSQKNNQDEQIVIKVAPKTRDNIDAFAAMLHKNRNEVIEDALALYTKEIFEIQPKKEKDKEGLSLEEIFDEDIVGCIHTLAGEKETTPEKIVEDALNIGLYAIVTQLIEKKAKQYKESCSCNNCKDCPICH